MIKKLKKKVIVKEEEAGELGKSSKQEDENIELEQQINVEENKVSKSYLKEVESVEDVLTTELNQGVKEDVKEQKQSPITVLSKEDEKYLSDEARVPTTDETRVYSKQEIHTHIEEETVSQNK